MNQRKQVGEGKILFHEGMVCMKLRSKGEHDSLEEIKQNKKQSQNL
jgi:hypothetical protein